MHIIPHSRPAIDRRRLLTASAAAGLAMGFGGGSGGFTTSARANNPLNQSYGEVITKTPFARLEKIAEGVWAVVSTPLKPDGTFNPDAVATLCNGGLIAGADRVVAIDAFFQPAGAAWLSSVAQDVVGRPITDVVVTHFHADHSGGLAGFQNGADGPDIIATDTTRKLIFERYATGAPRDDSPFDIPPIRPVMPTKIISDETKTITLDLGDRTITIDPMRGHTPSDIAIAVDDAPVIFAGDLIWSGLFHNYVDAIPSALRNAAGRLLQDRDNIIVTGHGYVATARDLGNYLDLLDHVEGAARKAHQAGKPPAEGAKTFSVPKSLGEWQLFNPKYYETAFEAWRRELDGTQTAP